METVLSALLLISLLLFGALTLAEFYFTSQDNLAACWREMSARTDERSRTDLEVIATDAQSTYIDLTIRNSGGTKLADFDRWDLLLHYYTALDAYVIAWFPYVDDASGSYWWQVVGIYADAATLTSEMYEPGVFNPDEEMIVRVVLATPHKAASQVMADLVTPNGIGAAAVFTTP